MGFDSSEVYTLLTMKKGRKTEKTYRMTPYLEKRIAKVEEDIKHNRNIVGPFKTPEEMDKFLDSLR